MTGELDHCVNPSPDLSVSSASGEWALEWCHTRLYHAFEYSERVRDVPRDTLESVTSARINAKDRLGDDEYQTLLDIEDDIQRCAPGEIARKDLDGLRTGRLRW